LSVQIGQGYSKRIFPGIFQSPRWNIQVNGFGDATGEGIEYIEANTEELFNIT